jgi:type I restriction enzyme S subunit
MASDWLPTPYGDFAADFCLDRLSNLCDRECGVQTGPFGSQLHKKDYVAIGTPIITVEHLGENRILSKKLPCVSDADRKRLSKYQMHKGDIVFSRVGSVDRRALVRDNENGWLFSGRCLRLRPNPAKIYPAYLSYFFGLPAFKEHIRAIAVGATMPSLNTKILSDVLIPYPKDLHEQRAIAYILGSLDDKIELNRRMNETLETMAHAIFKSWFVDFDPVRAKAKGRDPNLPGEIAALFPDGFEDSELGEIPKGWRVNSLDKIADYMNGLACQKYQPEEGKESLPVIKIRELRQGITANTDRATAGVPVNYIVEDGDVLFSWSGSLLIDIWTQGRGVLNQHLFKVTSSVYPKWFYYYWTDHHLTEFQRIAAYKATTMGHIKRHHLADSKVFVPDDKLLQEADGQISPLFNLRIQNELENRKLASLRDTLLPKLISGDLRVPDAEKIVEEVV